MSRYGLGTPRAASRVRIALRRTIGKRDLLRHADRSDAAHRQTTRLGAQRPLHWTLDQDPVRTDTTTAVAAPDLQAHSRWRRPRRWAICRDRPAKRRNAHGKSLRGSSNLSAARALRRSAQSRHLACSTTIRSTPVLFFRSSAREMAAALCSFVHRSQQLNGDLRCGEPSPRRHHGHTNRSPRKTRTVLR